MKFSLNLKKKKTVFVYEKMYIEKTYTINQKFDVKSKNSTHFNRSKAKNPFSKIFLITIKRKIIQSNL